METYFLPITNKQQFSLFQYQKSRSKASEYSYAEKDFCVVINLTHYQTTNFRLVQIKHSADDNFKFDENTRKLSERVENTVGKRRNCSLRAISPFPTVFSKGLFARGVKRCHCVGIGYNYREFHNTLCSKKKVCTF